MSSAVQAFEDNEMAVSETSSNITEEKKFIGFTQLKIIIKRQLILLTIIMKNMN